MSSCLVEPEERDKDPRGRSRVFIVRLYVLPPPESRSGLLWWYGHRVSVLDYVPFLHPTLTPDVLPSLSSWTVPFLGLTGLCGHRSVGSGWVKVSVERSDYVSIGCAQPSDCASVPVERTPHFVSVIFRIPYDWNPSFLDPNFGSKTTHRNKFSGSERLKSIG